MTPAFTITDLDFDSILNNFRSYLKSQTTFQDYNFDGSAITELLKVLSYNTFYNAFYINNISNEMYLDSALDRSAVVSRAKSLGYIPTSSLSSKIYVDLVSHISKVVGETPPTSSSFVSLDKYSKFVTSVNNIDYTFITPEVTSLYYDSEDVDSWIYKAKNVKIVEGTNLNYAFSVTGEYEKYVIPNKNVDVTSLIVRIYETPTSLTYTTYNKVSLMTDSLDSTSEVYWLYEGIDEKYYLEFGNDVLGKKLNINNVVYIEYITTNGAGGNGSQSFVSGDYSYTDSNITETESISITPSVYTILNTGESTATFTTDTLIRGLTSNNTAYVSSFDTYTNALTTYSSNTSFVFGETIREETILNGNVVVGASATVLASRTSTSTTAGGSDVETISNIKTNAPKLYAAQNRLITAGDYESIITHEYPHVESIVCWGGEDETPQELGTIFLAIKPKSRETLEVWEKNYIANTIIDDRKSIGMSISIVDPDYVYIYPTISVKYSSDTTTSTSQSSIITAVQNTISAFNILYLNSFNTSFYYSSFCSAVDSSDEFILGNETEIQLIKVFAPLLNVPYTSNNVATLYFSNTLSDDVAYFPITSSTFSCNTGGVTVNNCYFTPSSISPQILSVADEYADIIIPTAGTVDFGNGIITISNITITDTAGVNSSNNHIINIKASPISHDLTCSKTQILSIYPVSSNITAIPTKSKK